MKFLLITAILLLTCCTGRAGTNSPAKDSAEAVGVVEVPDSIFDPQQRADYTVLHYWDRTNLDALTAADLQSVWPSYAEACTYASAQAMETAAKDFLDALQSHPELYRQTATLARESFYTRQADTYSPSTFLPWARIFAASSLLSEGELQRYKYLLQALLKNYPGSPATDIELLTREGVETTLFQLPSAPYTLLVLYDPDCDTCHQLLERVRGQKQLTDMVDRGTVAMVLVDVADDEEAFRTDAANMPKNWTVAMDRSGIEDNDLYIFDTTPVLYLLDAQKKVLLKDASFDDLMNYARTH